MDFEKFGVTYNFEGSTYKLRHAYFNGLCDLPDKIKNVHQMNCAHLLLSETLKKLLLATKPDRHEVQRLKIAVSRLQQTLEFPVFIDRRRKGEINIPKHVHQTDRDLPY